VNGSTLSPASYEQLSTFAVPLVGWEPPPDLAIVTGPIRDCAARRGGARIKFFDENAGTEIVPGTCERDVRYIYFDSAYPNPKCAYTDYRQSLWVIANSPSNASEPNSVQQVPRRVLGPPHRQPDGAGQVRAVVDRGLPEHGERSPGPPQRAAVVFRRKSSDAGVLVVAGEGSGDAMAAPVVRQLGVPAFGLGGTALGAVGMELVSDLSRTAAMGVGAVLVRAPLLIDAGRRLLSEARRRKPRAALLVGFSEFNAWLGPRLRKLGMRVLWYSPPQIWAWRGGRADTLRDACDRMAVILPFEEELWRAHGADAHYVGHPSLERLAVA
jgi:hypothetical protein